MAKKTDPVAARVRKRSATRSKALAEREWKPGESGNPNGRPKGAKNKITVDLKTAFADMLQNNAAQMEKDLMGLTPEKRLLAIARFAEFVVPKKSEIDTKGTTTIIMQPFDIGQADGWKFLEKPEPKEVKDEPNDPAAT